MIRLKSLLTEGENLLDGAINRGVSVANALKSKLGLKSFQAAAIAGNFVEESGVRPDARQDMTGKGQYLPGPIKIDGRTGYSFGQWTFQPRQESLYKFAKSRGLDIKKERLTSNIAIDFVVYELTTEYSSILKQLKSSKSLSDATNIILTKYERPANMGPSALTARTQHAQEILDKMVKDTAPKKPVTDKAKSEPAKTGVAAVFDYMNREFEKANAALAKSKTNSTTTATTYHTVSSGDTLSGIASKYKIKVDTIKKLNKLTSDMIKPGQKLKIK